MQVFAVFDAKGLPKGFYTPVIHQNIPVEAVPISIEQWHQLIGNKGKCRWDGESVVEYVPPPESVSVFSTMLRRFRSRYSFLRINSIG